MKKLLILVSCFIFLFTLNCYADETNNNNSILQEFINDRNRVIENWFNYMPSEDGSTVSPYGAPYGSIGSVGDILTSWDTITGHVGIVVDMYTVIEGHPDTEDVAIWPNEWPLRYNKIKGVRVSGATLSNNRNAVSYAKQQLGETYTLLTDHWSEDKWYCSKLVWMAYYKQGFDIEDGGPTLRGTHVTPGDILDDDDTYVFYSYGY